MVVWFLAGRFRIRFPFRSNFRCQFADQSSDEWFLKRKTNPCLRNAITGSTQFVCLLRLARMRCRSFRKHHVNVKAAAPNAHPQQQTLALCRHLETMTESNQHVNAYDVLGHNNRFATPNASSMSQRSFVTHTHTCLVPHFERFFPFISRRDKKKQK